VGCRYTRSYEIDYINIVKEEIGDDTRITLHDVTDDVDPLYQEAGTNTIYSIVRSVSIWYI
jgi:hypothetical protein